MLAASNTNIVADRYNLHPLHSTNLGLEYTRMVQVFVTQYQSDMSWDRQNTSSFTVLTTTEFLNPFLCGALALGITLFMFYKQCCSRGTG